MDVGLHHRGIDPQLLAVFQSECDGRRDHQIIHRPHRLWRDPHEAALERIVIRHLRAGEASELTQCKASEDTLTQLPIVPVLAPHVRCAGCAALQAPAARERKLKPGAPSLARTTRSFDAVYPTCRPCSSHARKGYGGNSTNQGAQAKVPPPRSVASEQHRTAIRIGFPSYLICVIIHTYMSTTK